MENTSPFETEHTQGTPILSLVAPEFDTIQPSDSALLVHLKQCQLNGAPFLSDIPGVIAGLITNPSVIVHWAELTDYLKTAEQYGAHQKKLMDILQMSHSSITYSQGMGVVGISRTGDDGFVACNNYEDCICIAMVSRGKGAAQIHISPRVFSEEIAAAEFSNQEMRDDRLDVQLAVRLHHLLYPEQYRDLTLVDAALERARIDTSFSAQLWSEVLSNDELREIEFTTIGGNPESQRHINNLLKNGGSMRLKKTRIVDRFLPIARMNQLRSVNYRTSTGNSITKEVFVGAKGILIREQNDPRHRIFSLPNNATTVDSLNEANPFSNFIPLS